MNLLGSLGFWGDGEEDELEGDPGDPVTDRLLLFLDTTTPTTTPMVMMPTRAIIPPI